MHGHGASPSQDSVLARLAREHGIERSYTDIGGQTHAASPDALRAVLAALGVDADTDEQAQAQLKLASARRWNRPLEPVVVAWEGEGSLTLHLPEHAQDSRFSLTVQGDAGQPPVVVRGRLDDHPVATSDTVDGTRFVARQLRLPERLALGYHRVTLEVQSSPAVRGEAVLLSAPRQAYAPKGFESRRAWGLFCPLYSLHGDRSPGAGDLGDLRTLMEWTSERGGSVVGTLPLLAGFLREPFEASPYAPASRLAWNELYLHLESVPEYQASAKAKAAYEGAEAEAERARLRALPQVAYREQMAFKRTALEAMAERCFASQSDRTTALRQFAAQRPEIDEYAQFRAVGDKFETVWPQWPRPLRQGLLGQGDYRTADYRYHLYVQWLMHEQLSALATQKPKGSLGLYLDLPVGVNGCGFDIWRHPEVYVRGLSTGAPPDALFSGGQNWGFPPLHPERLRDNGYAHLIDVIRNHLRYAGVLRIDHVMGLHRLYVIPQGASAKEGIYVRYRPQELYAIITIESHRARCLVVGEDLGTVPDAVRESMARHRIHNMHVVQYVAQADEHAELPEAPSTSVAGINTHDMPPFAAYWTGSDIDERAALGWLTKEQVHAEHHERGRLRANLRRHLAADGGTGGSLPPDSDATETLRACLRHLGRSPAPLALINLEDLWGETEPQNVPGTYLERPNWRRRAAVGLSQLDEHPEVLASVAELDAARRGTRPKIGAVRHDVAAITQDDCYLLAEGTHERLYDVLGAHPAQVDGVDGTRFSVWAPSAHYVAVIGDFNGWDRGAHPLAVIGGSGVWQGFIPGVGPGALYKLHIAGPNGWSQDKADPFAFRSELPPRTASVVTRSEYRWNDDDWMKARPGQQSLHAPMSIYEVHLGSWRRVPEEGDRMLSYREVAPRLVEHCLAHGFTHVELMPVMEHPFYGSWGYQVTGYFAPTARYGRPDDLRFLVDALHQAGIGVIVDWVPSHFPVDAHGLAFFDGTHLFEHADPRQGFHPDWNSAIFNYGRHEVRSFLISSALYWLDEFHMDGLRVDGVASMLYLDYSREEGQWVPNEHGGRENLAAIALLRRLNEAVYRNFPGAQTIAEESTAWPMVSRPTDAGGLGFGLKWDMGWMHDTLQYMAREPVHRGWHQDELTFRMLYAFTENYVLSLSHDEVVHLKGSMIGKMPGDGWQKFANLRLLYGYMWGQPGKKHLFMGQEFGQGREWDHDRSLDWHLLDHPLHQGLSRWVGDLNQLYRQLPSLHQWDNDPRGFTWIDFRDAEHSVYSFMRHGEHGGITIVVLNFTPVPRHDYRVGVPRAGHWQERLNSDATVYGGSGVGNPGGVQAESEGAHGQPHSVRLSLPPLGVLFLHQSGHG